MKMDRLLSDKYRIASFIATIMVVVRHCANIQAFFAGYDVPVALALFESGMVFVTDVAVPFFFFASGFFFMRDSYYGVDSFGKMLQKKFWTLFVPFAVWNVIGALVLLIYDKHGALGNSLCECIHNFLMSFWYGPLWYVRDIMLLMLIYPIYGWTYRRWGHILLVLFIVYWMWTRWHPGWCDLLTGEGVIFFLLGGLFQQYQMVLSFRFSRWISLLAFALWMLMSFTFTSWDGVVHRVSLLIALPAAWISLDLMSGKTREWCLIFAPYSFLIYVTHFYLQKTLKVGLATLFPQNAWMALFAFFFVPVVCVTFAIVLGKFWKQKFPKSYSICVGGR